MSQAMIKIENGPGSMEAERGRPVRSLGFVLDAAPDSAPPPRRLYGWLGKRLLDVFVASFVLFLVTPLLALVWIILRASLGRRVVLRQERVGRNGQTFMLLKFRTMKGCRRRNEASCSYVGINRRHGHKSCDDPRHTRIGRVIRKFSLDELPQLLNVLAGDMSLVGPRPELASVATEDFLCHVRHAVRPGLTGPFQVSEFRGNGDLQAGLALDEGYVSNLKLVSDMRYLAKTAGVIRQGTGS